MTRRPPRRLAALALAVAAPAITGCGDGSGPGQAILDCDEAAPTSLAPGQARFADAAEEACVRLVEAGTGGAE